MNSHRVRLLKEGTALSGPVVYWMSRDQRVRDNWALLYARNLAMQRQAPFLVLFCLTHRFLEATIRQYRFMLKGLREVEHELAKKNIAFIMLTGDPATEVPTFLKSASAGALVTDFDPLRIKREWSSGVARKIDIPFYQVDAHNIVPCWFVSPKQEYAAYTFRPKILKLLPDFLDDIPALRRHPFSMSARQKAVDWEKLEKTIDVDRSVGEVNWIIPGEKAARQVLKAFIEKKLSSYDRARNDPTIPGQSDLSPYLHFGQISAQRVALEVKKSKRPGAAGNAFLEELIVRRELSDNFCFYNEKYDMVDGFPNWAQETLRKHRNKPREYRYTRGQFEHAQTHDDLWNAAQTQMVEKGKMHGYMRMYWAKKILEWTESPETAMETAIYLNDKYELDGRDPNGYAGIAWSIGGVHDRAWNERRIFGKIRYMSYNGCRGKFNVSEYVRMNQTGKKIPHNKKVGSVDARERLRQLNSSQFHAVLATEGGGQPYTSLVAFALTPDMRGVLFATPRETTKFKNIQKNSKVSLLIDTRKNTPEGYMASEAVTVLGRAGAVRKGKRRDILAGILSGKHPQLTEFINAPSTALILVMFESVIHAGKFQVISTWDKTDA